METNPAEYNVIHNEAESHFEIWIDDSLSKLDYLRDGNTMVMMHVGVPFELRKNGIAARLTQAALEYAEKNSLRVIPMCTYVAAYIRKHPEYQKLIKG
jgi:predicted GNAT family acetyltransferase